MKNGRSRTPTFWVVGAIFGTMQEALEVLEYRNRRNKYRQHPVYKYYLTNVVDAGFQSESIDIVVA